MPLRTGFANVTNFICMLQPSNSSNTMIKKSLAFQIFGILSVLFFSCNSKSCNNGSPTNYTPTDKVEIIKFNPNVHADDRGHFNVTYTIQDLRANTGYGNVIIKTVNFQNINAATSVNIKFTGSNLAGQNEVQHPFKNGESNQVNFQGDLVVPQSSGSFRITITYVNDEGTTMDNSYDVEVFHP